MRILLIYAHPVETSFHAALHDTIRAGLASRHTVDDCDLYAEGFEPRLSRAERLDYHDPAANVEAVAPYVARLLQADALVLAFPVWNYGYPAILKGFFDRVFVPGVTFRLDGGKVVPTLHNVRKVAAVTSYGSSRLRAMLMGDPPRKLVKRVLRATVRPGASVSYQALYAMNVASEARRRRFIAAVAARMEAF